MSEDLLTVMFPEKKTKIPCPVKRPICFPYSPSGLSELRLCRKHKTCTHMQAGTLAPDVIEDTFLHGLKCFV